MQEVWLEWSIMIVENDVRRVAEAIDKNISPKQIQRILAMYPEEQKQDPSGDWYLVVEHCIYQVLDC
ncbi:hypothetical protein LCGC14_3115380 [marine sediment metagenome]|uniref:Uncharacterized protein n=1 Tax=marine sediment metagenome TaxID=412755 RepID=A0A0F8W3X0_9ZZZZ